MATIVKCITPIDSVSGMLGSRDGNLSNSAIIVNVRKPGKSASNNGAAFMFLSVRKNDRSTPYSTDEITAQTKFAAVAASVRSRKKDPQYIQQDQAGFKAQTQYKTLHQYIWHQVWDSYED